MASSDAARIRSATAKDVDAVLAFWKKASDHTSVSDNPKSLRILLEHPAAWLLVVENEGTIVGTLVAAWDGWRGNFYRLAVDPSRRRRGMGTALVAEGERRMNACGARRNSAMVEGSDPVATAFWTAVGYRLDAKLSRYIKEAQ